MSKTGAGAAASLVKCGAPARRVPVIDLRFIIAVMGQVASRVDQGAPATSPPLPAVANCAHADAHLCVRDPEGEIWECPSCGFLWIRGFAARGEPARQVLNA